MCTWTVSICDAIMCCFSFFLAYLYFQFADALVSHWFSLDSFPDLIRPIVRLPIAFEVVTQLPPSVLLEGKN